MSNRFVYYFKCYGHTRVSRVERIMCSRPGCEYYVSVGRPRGERGQVIIQMRESTDMTEQELLQLVEEGLQYVSDTTEMGFGWYPKHDSLTPVKYVKWDPEGVSVYFKDPPTHSIHRPIPDMSAVKDSWIEEVGDNGGFSDTARIPDPPLIPLPAELQGLL
jgi:hypothetical protein